MTAITNISALLEAGKREDVCREIKSLNNQSVYFRHMSAKERDDHEASIMTKGEVDPAKIRGIRQRLLQRTLSDGQGTCIAKPSELDSLPAEVIDELAEIAAEINGMRKESKEEAGNA